MATLSLALLCSALAAVVTCTNRTTPPSTVPGCFRDGNAYKPGQSFGDTCSPCRCLMGGRVSCLVIDCMSTECVDAVYDKTKCCPTCPNGRNCRASDGTVIKEGDVYHPDNDTTCSCPTTSLGFPTGLERKADCIILF